MLDRAYTTFERWFEEVDKANARVGSFGKGFFAVQDMIPYVVERGVKTIRGDENPGGHFTLGGLAVKSLRAQTDLEIVIGERYVSRPAAVAGMALGFFSMYAMPLTALLDYLHGWSHIMKREWNKSVTGEFEPKPDK